MEGGALSVLLGLQFGLGGCGGGGDPAGRTDGVAAAEPAGGAEVRGFVDVTEELRITDFPVRGTMIDGYLPDSMLGGCALFDANGDGRLDVYVVTGLRAADGGLESEPGANRLFVQQDDGTFADETARCGLGDVGYGMGVAVGDVDGDGDEDVYLANHGRDRLYRNEGDGTFIDVSDSAGIMNDAWSSSVGFFDPDRDGDLDVFVVNYLVLNPGIVGSDAAGAPEFPAPGAFAGTADVLYRNDGRGVFTDVSDEAGVTSKVGRGLGVALIDLDGDELVDVYVANDNGANRAWINRGGMKFVNEAVERNLAVNLHGQPEASMGIAAGDTDGDGLDDLILTHLVQETHTHYRQTAPGMFVDTTVRAGLGASSIDRTGFGAAPGDFDLDGDLDLVVANGRVMRGPVAAGARTADHWKPYAEANDYFENDGTGRFALAPHRAGDLATTADVSRALALGDLDRDGDLDIVVMNCSGTVRIFRNELPRSGHWLTVKPVERAGGIAVSGTRVDLRIGRTKQSRLVGASGGYLSHHESAAHFGLGASSPSETSIDVHWPDGSLESFEVVGEVDRAIEVVRGSGQRAG